VGATEPAAELGELSDSLSKRSWSFRVTAEPLQNCSFIGGKGRAAEIMGSVRFRLKARSSTSFSLLERTSSIDIQYSGEGFDLRGLCLGKVSAMLQYNAARLMRVGIRPEHAFTLDVR